jgi:hypothetical protein
VLVLDVVVVFVVPPPPAVLVEELPEMGVWLEGQDPVDAVLKVPIAEVELHTAGILEAVGSPQEYGTIFARLAAQVRKAAYDHVKS